MTLKYVSSASFSARGPVTVTEAYNDDDDNDVVIVITNDVSAADDSALDRIRMIVETEGAESRIHHHQTQEH